MSDQALNRVNRAIEQASPALFAALSPLGRRVVYPPDIPFQAAQARGKAYNATIGQITDGHGRVLALPSLARGLSGLSEEARNRAQLYSPVEGIAELRRLWRQRQRRGLGAAAPPSTLPVVTVGLSHGLSIAADLFGGEGRAVAVPAPFWGNYRQMFAVRGGADVRAVPYMSDGRYDTAAIEEALADLPAGEPAAAILNLPSNPGGYSLTVAERERLKESLLAVAAARPLVVICDDAYAGLVYDEQIPTGSMFWELAGAHPNLLPVKVDGVTKELVFFGGRVGFLTFPFDPDSEIAAALESKAKCLSRGILGSPVAASQVLVLEALASGHLEEEFEAVRRRLGERARVLRQVLEGCDPALLRPLPFNSGCFALIELPEELGLTSEQVRFHLLEEEDTGIVSIAPRYVRIAFGSVSKEAIPELVTRLERGVRALSGR